jgi:hypothetical protein
LDFDIFSSELVNRWLIVLASTAFLYVSLSRAAVLRHETAARLIISAAISVTAISAISSHWKTLVDVAGYAIVAGLVSLLIWRVAVGRGRTRHEIENESRREERRWRDEQERRGRGR